MTSKSLVVPATPRQSVQVRFSDGQVFEAPLGTRLEAFIEAGSLDSPSPVVAALVNGHLRELTYEMTSDAVVSPITIATGDGKRIYQRAFSKGLAWIPAGHILRMSPPIIMEDEVLLKGLELIEEAIGETEKELGFA